MVNISTFTAFGHELLFRNVHNRRIIRFEVFEGNLKELGPFLMRMYRHFLSLPGMTFA
jgi:hypothetical protein